MQEIWNIIVTIVVRILEHEVIVFCLIAISLIFIFLWRRYLAEFLKSPHNLLKSLERKFLEILYKKDVDKIRDCTNRKLSIKKDINAHIKIIKSSKDNNQKFTSAQYLLKFPSEKGFLTLMQLAISLNDRESQIKLICDMCKSAKAFEWHKI